MKKQDQHPDNDSFVYQLWTESLSPDSDPIDVDDLAAWFEGTLDDEARDSIEARLALDPASRELVAEREVPPTLEASAELIDRLVSLGSREEHLMFESHARQATHRAWWTSSGIAAAVALAALGFWTGQLAATDADRLEQQFLAAATFNVFDGSIDTNAFDEAIVEMTRNNEVSR